MKTLIVQRHGRAESSGESDLARKLSDQGKEDVRLMGKKYRRAHVFPEMIFTSPARRAVKTARLLAEAFEFDRDEIVELPELYNDSAAGLLILFRNAFPDCDHVMVVGHNPVLLELINLLSRDPIYSLKPGDAVVLEFQTPSWSDIGRSNCIDARKIVVKGD